MVAASRSVRSRAALTAASAVRAAPASIRPTASWLTGLGAGAPVPAGTAGDAVRVGVPPPAGVAGAGVPLPAPGAGATVTPEGAWRW